jgi:hypothetical protein
VERCSSEISPATNGTFAIKRDAFQFARPPEGTFTHAAIADYDRDGRLDIYFCLYSYYLASTSITIRSRTSMRGMVRQIFYCMTKAMRRS